MKLIDVLSRIRVILRVANIDSTSLDSRIIVGYALNIEYDKVLLHRDQYVSKQQYKQILNYVYQRAEGMPIAYLIGQKDFWKHSYIVDNNVLIPRADSETLISAVLDLYPKPNYKYNILDLGTGSGCLLLSLLGEYTTSSGTGIDLNSKAIDIANKNAINLNLVDRVQFIHDSWFGTSWRKQFDIIVSNPPYIPSQNIARLMKDVKDYEPITALDGGSDGLDCYHQIFSILSSISGTNAKLFLEIGAGQDTAIINIAKNYNLELQAFHRDLSGITRVLVLRYNKLCHQE